MSCSQNFSAIIRSITKKTDGGENPFIGFSNIVEMDEQRDQIVDSIADKIADESRKSTETILSYDFNAIGKQLKKLSDKKYKGLTEDVVSEIISRIQLKLTKDEDLFLTNPIILKEDGSSDLLFDFSNISNLTGGIQSMENFIDSELQSGLFKATFIDTSDNVGSEEYEPFVVTNTDLNKNLLIYKNELWSYIVSTAVSSGNFNKKLKDTKLYENGKLNWQLFVKNENGVSPYMEVLMYLKNEMSNRLSSADSYNHIKIYKDRGYSISQAYLKALILSNFDNFVLSKHPDKVTVNKSSINTFDIPINGEEKYNLQFQWSKSVKIDNSEVASDIDKNSSSLVKMLSDIIPYYEEVSVGTKGNTRWIRNRNGLTIGKSNLDSIGAILNDINPNFTFNVPVIVNNKVEFVNMTIGEAFKRYDSGEVSFESILTGLLNSVDSNDQLKSRESVLRSLKEFLYGQKGLKNKFDLWKASKSNYADFVVNPEIALINHIRNTVKNIYRKENISLNGKTLDVLNIESAVGSDFESLVNNLEIAWRSKSVTIDDLSSIVDYDSFFRFLTDPSKGGLVISERAKELFKKNVPIDFESEGFKREIKKLFIKHENGVREEFDLTNLQNVEYVELDTEEIIEVLKSKDVNDHLKLKELFKYRHYSSKYNILTQVKDSTGASMPTMGIANLASLFNISLASANKESFFKKNPNLYSGMEILLEVIGENKSISTADLYNNEAFKLGFTRQFLASGLNEDKYLIQPWDFSDKPKIFAIGIKSTARMMKSGITQDGRQVYKPLKDFNPEELRKEFYEQQKSHYNKLVEDAYKDYKLLDPEWFIKYNKKNSIESALDKIEAIETFLKEKVETKEELQELVSKVFNAGGYVDIVEDLHYSMYGKVPKFNQQLKGNVQIFNNEHHFERWANMKEAKLLKYLDNIDISLGEIVIKNGRLSDKRKMSEIAKYYNIPESELFEKVEDEDLYKLIKSKKVGDKTKLSDIFSKYLWTKNLIVSQYANLTTKDVYLHPAKKDFENIDLNNEESWKAYETEENMRSTTFTKRMNIPGASMTIYGRGRNGISSEIKVAVMDDPSAETFNYAGETHNQDVSDGGGHTNPFFNELLVWSLPGLDLKKTQKPIGESINGKYASTLKFAIFAISNEEVLKSMSSNRSAYTAMKKMNDFPLFEEDEEVQDIMKVKDSETGKISTIDLSASFNDLWIPIKGVYHKFESLQWIGGNTYSLNYSDSNGDILSKEVKINTLFDLWNALGGPFSATKSGDTFTYSEDSIKAVSSIIKKHSMANSSIKLKDKMIAMLLPKSAVKKGATNVSNVKTVYDKNSKLPYFNFDTSFFGIQLKSHHSIDDSHTNEITQVISGIAENASTPELYNAVYNAIGNMVQDGLNKFGLIINSDSGRKKIIDNFVKKLNNSDQINNSRIIVNGLMNDLEETIPIENKTIYKQFISYVVSNINVDFIRRQFKGIASVLNPSHGIIKIFEDKNGRKLFSSDLLHLFETNPANITFVPSSEDLSEYDLVSEKINWVIQNSPEFKEDLISISQIEPLDFIRLDKDITLNGETIPANTIIEVNKINDYFDLKNELKDSEEKINIYRVYNKSRDLKPVRVTFDVNSSDKLSETDKVVYGHNALGKSFLFGQGESKFVSLDDDFKPEIDKYIDEHRGELSRQDYKAMHPEDYNNLLLKLWEQTKEKAKREGKIAIVSNYHILRQRPQDFDKVITLTKEEFKRRLIQRGMNKAQLEKDFDEWKSNIDEAVSKIDPSKVLVTDKYLSDLSNTKSNLYDLESVEFSWWLGKNKKQLEAGNFDNLRESDVVRYKEFVNYIVSVNKIDGSKLLESQKYDLAKEYGKRWVNRNFELLKNSKTFKSFSELKQTDPSLNAFDLMLSYSTEDGNIVKDNFTSRYLPNNTYGSEVAISNYVHRNAENVHSNVNRKNFNLDNVPMAEVTRDHFYKTIRDFTLSSRPPKRMSYDLVLSNANDKSSIYVALNNKNYYEKNNKLYYKYSNKPVGSKVYINEDVKPNGDRIRLSNFGEKMYELPKNYSIFKDDATGQEILLIKENIKSEEEVQSVFDGLKDFTKKLDSYNIIRFNNYNSYAKNLASDKDDYLLELMTTLKSSASNKYLRDHLSNKIKDYSKFKASLDSSILTDEVKLKNMYTEFVKTYDSNEFKNYLNILSDVRYASWKKSVKALSARIPAQAMQSFMSMDTVGYISGDANDIYVSHWQLWLQGSDYDIDKLYMMMYEFKDGIFAGWSPYFDILKERSFELPLPSKRPDYIWVNPADLTAEKASGEDADAPEKENKNLKYEPEDLNDDNTIDLDQLFGSERDPFKKLIIALKALEGEFSIKHIKTSDKNIVNKINRHNNFSSEAGFKNFIVYNLLKTSEDPSNQLSSYSPISFGVYEDIKKKLPEQYSLSLYDGHTMYMQQEQNSVGKKVIGIAATGLKNYFALIKYYSDYYKSVEENGEIDTSDNEYFIKQFTLVDKKGNPKVFTIDKISGLNLSDDGNNILKSHLKSLLKENKEYINKYTGKKFKQEELDKIVDEISKISPDVDAALAISSILSLATDNAKELMLAKINAGIDFAGMHIYLNMLGIDTETVSNYMISPDAKAIKDSMKRDIFVDTKDPSVIVRLNKLISKNYEKFELKFGEKFNHKKHNELSLKYENSKNPIEKEDLQERIDIGKAIIEDEELTGINQEFLNEFINIYMHASELTSMGSILKVNQGSKSSQEDLYKLSNQIQTILSNQAANYYRDYVGTTIDDEVNYIISEKPYLKDKRAKIIEILKNAEKEGIAKGGKVDVYRYFTDNKDDNYRKVVTDYYNLIKYTFNIFDMLNKLPHFYQMYKSFIVGDNYLTNSVPKYKFLKEYAPEIIKEATSSKELNVFELMKNLHTMGNVELPVSFSPDVINGLNDYYDSKILKSFMKSLDIKIGIKEVMDYLKINSISLLDNRKEDIYESTYSIDDVADMTIDFDSEYGLAQFRYVMENYIIPYEKKKHKSNGFLKQYVFNSHKNYNLRNRVNYYLDKSNFSELEELEVGMNQLIRSGDSSENTEEGSKKLSYELPIIKSEETTNSMKLIDLLSLYDLLINEGKFGGNRSTIFFSKDMDNKNSISRKFIDYQNKFGADPNLAKTIYESLKGDEGYDSRIEMYLRLFSKTGPDGKKSVKLFEDGAGNSKIININRYFTLLDSAKEAFINFKAINLAQDIVTFIKNTYTNIDKNCE